MEDLISLSYRHCYVTEAQNILNDSLTMSQAEFECGSENVVRVKCVLQSFQRLLSQAMGKLTDAKLKVDVVGIPPEENIQPQPMQVERRLSDKLTVLVNDIDIAMKKLSFGLYRGKVYKKVNTATYTFTYKCDPREFVNSLATNEFYKPRLLGNMRRIIDLMSDPYCEVMAPLRIDYDLVEVNNGMIWSIKERKFLPCPIPTDKIGHVSPRAFCDYDHEKEPDPKYFKQIVDNSLSEEEKAVFCEDFLRLLNYNGKKHKEKVPCLVGESNSGKSSLFFPILGIVNHTNIATITKQRSFNKAMITKFTECVFIDEATESTLAIDDWKVLMQGGFAAFDVKYETAKAFINRCPMLITAQQKLSFSGEDQKAMDKRLRTYNFQSLPCPKKNAANWLKRHPMDCIVWASKKAATLNQLDEDEHSGSEDDLQPENDCTLDETEKDELRSFAPLEIEPTCIDLNEESKNGQVLQVEEDETDDTRIAALNDVLKNTAYETLRFRQAQELLAREKQRVKANRRNYQKKQDRYKELGVSTQNLHFVPTTDDEPDPTPIVLEREAFKKTKMQFEIEQRKKVCKDLYQDKWLIELERKLYDCVVTLEESTSSDVRAGAQGVREIYTNKLKLYHQEKGTLLWEEALKERRLACVRLGLLDKRDQHLVTSLDEALPYKKKELGIDDDESFFITPTPRKRKNVQSSERSASQPSKKKNTSILSYFKNYFA